MCGMAAGSAMEDRAIDAWSVKVHAKALRLHGMVLGVDPKAVRIVEMVQAETFRSEVR
jgi:hypothetical protein